MKRIKVGIFMDSYFPNVDGVVMVIDQLSTYLKKYAEITVVVPKTSTYLEDFKKPYSIIRVKSINVPMTEYHLGIPTSKIWKQLEQEKFDIIHIHSPFTIGKLGVKYAKKHNIPVIATMHTRFDFEFRKYLKSKWLTKQAIKLIVPVFESCDDCVAVNHAMIKVFHDYGYQRTPIVIHNGTEMTLIDEKDKNLVNEKYQLDPKELVFLFVGRINEVKNIFFLLDALKVLKESGLSFKMFYVGAGPDEKKLSDRIQEYRLEDCVILTGKITDRTLLKSMYYRAKLFLFPSLFDASSLVQIEAASQKTPTLFIEGSVTSDTVTNNQNGFTAPNNVEDYAKRIIDIVNDEKLYQKVSENAYLELARPWSDIAKETYQFYLKEIQKKEKE